VSLRRARLKKLEVGIEIVPITIECISIALRLSALASPP